MILKPDEIDNAVLAGKIAGKAIVYGRSLIKPDACVVDVLDQIEAFIEQQGAKMAFPAQVSMNDVAAHYCPAADDPRIFTSTDIIKLDLGVHVDGIIADNAITIVFDSEKRNELLRIRQASHDALKNALKMMTPGTRIGDIGLMIQETIGHYDLSPIRNLSGHGLGKFKVHESPTIPNVNTGEKNVLQEGQLVAVEPFATNGQGVIYESMHATLFSINVLKPVRNQITRDVLQDIKSFQGLPFTTRWLTKKHSVAKVRFALNDLKNNGILQEYPPLVEMGHGMVSQTEHTVIVRDKPLITTLRDEEL